MQPNQQPRDPSVFTVSQLNQRAKQLLEVSFASVKVEGEISNLARPSSGHWYFTLKDDRAQVRCAMFRSRTAMLKFQPKEGDRVEIRAKVSLYENRGDYQLIVDAMKPAGEGALLLAFEQLKQRLGQEGLFHEQYKQPIPNIKRLAVITSPTGAAIQDILSVLKRRWPSTEVDIYPTLVQGAEAVPQIIRAIQLANHFGNTDAIILGRGGGSLEDLWSFNDEQVARAIFASRIPIISAVGHEVDFTIADFVADVRAPTPSAAAELASPDQKDVFIKLSHLQERLKRTADRQLQTKSIQLEHTARRLQNPEQKLQEYGQRLDRLEFSFIRSAKQRLIKAEQKAQILDIRLKQQHPELAIQGLQDRVAQLNKRLTQQVRQNLTQKTNLLSANVRLLNSVNPLEVLGRGYSITQKDDGSVIESSQDLKQGDLITTQLKSGQIHSQITDIIHQNNK